MTNMIHRVRLLLSSPGNMSGDRETVRKVVGTINRDSGRRDGFFVEIVDWESFSRPSIGEYPQEVLNDQFPDEIDIFVGLMGV